MIWALLLFGAFLGVQAWPIGWSDHRPWTHDLLTDHLGYNDHGYYNGPWNPEYIRSHGWYNPSRSLHVGDDHDDFFHGDLNDHYYDYRNRDFSDYYHGDINDHNHGTFDDDHHRGNRFHNGPSSFLDRHYNGFAGNFELDSSFYHGLHRPIEMATENYVREYPFKGMEYGIRDSVSFSKPAGYHSEHLPTRFVAPHHGLEHGPPAFHHLDDLDHGPPSFHHFDDLDHGPSSFHHFDDLDHGPSSFHRFDDLDHVPSSFHHFDDLDHGPSSFHHFDDYDHLGFHSFDCEENNKAFHRRSFAPGLSHLPIPFRMGSDILLRR